MADQYIPGTDMLPARQDRALKELGRYMTKDERACMFKQKHTQASAEHEARRLKGIGEDRAKAYECPRRECRLDDGRRSWHVGRKPQERNR